MRGGSDHLKSKNILESSKDSRNELCVSGIRFSFSPSGKIVFFGAGIGLIKFCNFDKIHKGEYLSNYTLGEFRGEGVVTGDFLDNEHFCVCFSKRVEIYKVFSCDTWNPKNISKESFKKLQL